MTTTPVKATISSGKITGMLVAGVVRSAKKRVFILKATSCFDRLALRKSSLFRYSQTRGQRGLCRWSYGGLAAQFFNKGHSEKRIFSAWRTRSSFCGRSLSDRPAGLVHYTLLDGFDRFIRTIQKRSRVNAHVSRQHPIHNDSPQVHRLSACLRVRPFRLS